MLANGVAILMFKRFGDYASWEAHKVQETKDYVTQRLRAQLNLYQRGNRASLSLSPVRERSPTKAPVV